jgi:hypothetical protein
VTAVRRVPLWTARPIGVQPDGSVRRVVRHGDRWQVRRSPVTGRWYAGPADGRVYLNQALTLRQEDFPTKAEADAFVVAELRKLDGR